MIDDLEHYIHTALSEKGAADFMVALSRVCMTISQQTGNTTANEKATKQAWLTLSARTANAADMARRVGMDPSPGEYRCPRCGVRDNKPFEPGPSCRRKPCHGRGET